MMPISIAFTPEYIEKEKEIENYKKLNYIDRIKLHFDTWSTHFLGLGYKDIYKQVSRVEKMKIPFEKPYIFHVKTKLWKKGTYSYEGGYVEFLRTEKGFRCAEKAVALPAYNITLRQWEWQVISRACDKHYQTGNILSTWGFIFGNVDAYIDSEDSKIVNGNELSDYHTWKTEKIWNKKATELGETLRKLLNGKEVVIRGNTYTIHGPELHFDNFKDIVPLADSYVIQVK